MSNIPSPTKGAVMRLSDMPPASMASISDWPLRRSITTKSAMKKPTGSTSPR